MPAGRILIFVHDGRGVGHLRRLSRLARQLQGAASVLFLTGLREVSWLVPATCEFVHVPSRDSLESARSQHWLRDPFVPEGSAAARNLRPRLIDATVKAFDPDALIVDYLPLGRDEELYDIVCGLPNCRKYYISRGVLGNPCEIRTDVLTPVCLDALRNQFSRILVMSDIQIIDTVKEYGFDSLLASKVTYTGYAIDVPSPEQVRAMRRARGISAENRWVVCSAGGGKSSEDLIQKCWELSRQFPEANFDIVAGPRSRLRFKEGGICNNGRVSIVDTNIRNLALMHAAADVVITHGGYNSLLEACVGSAHIIVMPIPWDYEQREHARRLSCYRQINIIQSLDNLDVMLESSLTSSFAPQPLSSSTLRLKGIRTAADIILQDLVNSSAGLPDDSTGLPEWSHAL